VANAGRKTVTETTATTDGIATHPEEKAVNPDEEDAAERGEAAEDPADAVAEAAAAADQLEDDENSTANPETIKLESRLWTNAKAAVLSTGAQ